MGAWGMGHDESDDYLSAVATYGSPILAALSVRRAQVEQGLFRGALTAVPVSDPDLIAHLTVTDFRPQLVVSVHMLAAAGMVLDAHIAQLRDHVAFVRTQTERAAREWSDPDLLTRTVAAEMDAILIWLDELEPAGHPLLLAPHDVAAGS